MNNPISVTYSDERLRTIVEEYITMQKQEFTFKDLCSYVLYWAKEEGKTANTGLSYHQRQAIDYAIECIMKVEKKRKVTNKRS